MKKFKVLMILAIAFCFSQSMMAQGTNECDGILSDGMSYLQKNMAKLSAEEAQSMIDEMTYIYNRCMGQDYDGFETKKVRKKRPKSGRLQLEEVLDVNYPNSEVVRKVEKRPSYKGPRQTRNTPPRNSPYVSEGRPTENRPDQTRTRAQAQEQAIVQYEEEKGKNPERVAEQNKRNQERCRKYTQEQREQILRERDVAVNKISSAVQRRKIYAEADKKIRSVMFDCMQKMETQD